MKVAAILLTLLFAAVICAGQEAPAAEGKKDKKAESAKSQKATRWQGHIVRINEDKSSLSIRGGRGGGRSFEREVFYDSSTKWTKQGKPADKSEFKEGSFVIAVGKPDDKGNFHADRIDLRLPR